VAAKDPPFQCTFFVDLYPVKGRDADGVAQHIALAIDGGSRGAGIQCDRLEAFFVSCHTRFRRPLDLLLDEVDEALPLGVSRPPGNDRPEGILPPGAGGQKPAAIRDVGSVRTLFPRLSLMRLDPLTDPERRTSSSSNGGPRLQVTDKHAVLSLLQELTGKQPSLVQYYGKAAASRMLDSGSDTLTRLSWKQCGMRMRHRRWFWDRSRVSETPVPGAALGLLSLPRQPYTIPQVQTVVRSRGVESRPRRPGASAMTC